MTFEGQYLTYDDYLELGGTAIEEMPFNLLEFEARRQIDIRTLNRLKDLTDIPQEVQLCDKKLIDTLNTYLVSAKNIANSGNLKSESTDGYSVSYIDTSELGNITKSKETEIDDIIRTYLLGVVVNGEHIMYLGVK